MEDVLEFDVRFEALKQRSGQAVGRDRWAETPLGFLPEGTRHKGFSPPPLPAVQGATISADLLGKNFFSFSSNPLAHRRYQDHDDHEVDPAAEETDGGRRHPLSAALFSTAKTDAPIEYRGKIIWAASGFTGIVRPVESAAEWAACLPSLLSKILVIFEEHGEKIGIGKDFLVQGLSPLG